jgi:hypothetical protein
LSKLVVWVSVHFWTLVWSELALSFHVFFVSEQYCVLLVRSVFLQVLLNGVSGFVLRSAFRIALSRVFFLVLLLVMFSFLEQLSVASEVLAVKFYIAAIF